MTESIKSKFQPLSEKRVFQLLDGAKTFGNLTDACSRYQEDFYIDEAENLFEFAKWIDDYVGGVGPINIQQLWAAFHNQSDEQHWRIINYWKTKFNQIKNL